jgi:uncharacterized membrane protein
VRAESLHAIILLAAVVGLGLAGFAYAETVVKALQQTCSVSVFFSCSKVDQSGQTTLLGVPDWAVGVGGFLLMLAIDIPLYRSWSPVLLRALVAVSALGVAVSAYLAYVELFRIDALCPVCLSAYLANLVIFTAAVALLWKSRPAAASVTRESRRSDAEAARPETAADPAGR